MVGRHEFAVLRHHGIGARDGGGHLRVVLAEHQAIGLIGDEIADDRHRRLGFLARDEAIEQHVVGGESVGLAVGKETEGLFVVGRRDDVDAKLVFVVEQLHRRLVGRARRHDENLARQIAVGIDAGIALDQELGAGDENHRREGDALLALDIAGRRTAFEIDLAGSDRLHARVGRH